MRSVIYRQTAVAAAPALADITSIWELLGHGCQDHLRRPGRKIRRYARRQVESGEYASTSEVLRDALRLHEERAAFRSKLLDKIDEGLASPLVDFDIDRWFEEEFGEA